MVRLAIYTTHMNDIKVLRKYLQAVHVLCCGYVYAYAYTINDTK